MEDKGRILAFIFRGWCESYDFSYTDVFGVYSLTDKYVAFVEERQHAVALDNPNGIGALNTTLVATSSPKIVFSGT